MSTPEPKGAAFNATVRTENNVPEAPADDEPRAEERNEPAGDGHPTEEE